MPHFGNYNPSSFGWSVDSSQYVSFSYEGEPFPSGAHRLVVALFTGLTNDLVAAGLHVPTTHNPNVDGNWGADIRAVRGQSNLSFHAYGLALDYDAPHNPMTYDAGWGTMPHSSSAIARKWGCEWGGDWSGRRDLMHWEIHLAPSEVAGVVAANHGSVSVSTGATTTQPTLREGSTGAAVATVQRRLNLKPAKSPQFGPATKDAVVMYQKRHKITADGVVGPSTWTRLLSAKILPGERYVAEGCTGPDIGWLQRRLGLTPATHPAFGPKTGDALQAWKAKRRLGGGPSAGSVTWQALGANG